MRTILFILLLIPTILFAQTGHSKKGVVNGDSVALKSLRVGQNSNYVTIDTTSGIQLHGTSTVWDDIQCPFATGFSGGGSPNPALDTVLMAYTFTVDSSGSTQCMQYMNVQMSHQWAIGTSVRPHIHYLHQSAVGTPKFIVRYRWVVIGSTPTAWSWIRLENTTGTTDNTHQLVDDAGNVGISAAGITGVSAILQCRVYLRTTPANVKAFQFDVHYQKDALGSKDELTK